MEMIFVGQNIGLTSQLGICSGAIAQVVVGLTKEVGCECLEIFGDITNTPGQAARTRLSWDAKSAQSAALVHVPAWLKTRGPWSHKPWINH